MSVLDEICDRKRAHVKTQKNLFPLADLEEQIKTANAPRKFLESLKTASQTKTALIAEVKKASPSKGVIREDFDPVQIANIYEASGATCLSVLTDAPYFQGDDEYLKDIKAAVNLPCLRKDFMVDPYQIIESRALGADCILLIMAALDDSLAQELYTASKELGMDVLVETHDAQERERALKLGADMIGVNNRNLKTLDVDIQTSFDLAENFPPDVLAVAESGISSPETIHDLKCAGYRAFLVGESLMRQEDIAAATKELLSTH